MPKQTEQQTFEELGRLCISPGYIQALAFICFSNNVIGIDEGISSKDLLKMYSSDRLIGTEITTIIGLMLKTPIDFTLPEPGTVQKYIDETYKLTKALHEAMSRPFLDQITPERVKDPAFNPFGCGSALREPIFYSGEAAYTFQLRDLAVPKYSADNDWLKRHKGFSIEEARGTVLALTQVQNKNLSSMHGILKQMSPSDWSVLDGFTVTAHEIAQSCGYNLDIVRSVLSAFALPDGDVNGQFQSLHDFNVCTSTPLLKRGIDTFVLFSQHGLVQSLYESPFYWMIADLNYKDTAMTNRGQFAERFVRERLAHVFGDKCVFQGVKVFDFKGKEITDIDVFALFGNRAIVAQAKSKKLTLEARRGNDGQIKADFQKAVQDAYDQGYEAALALKGVGFEFRDGLGQPLRIPELTEIFIVSVLSEAYPALAFQTKQFLRVKTTESIRPPIVADVFSIDAMTEMLDSPLWLMDYIRRRSGYADKLHVSDELTALSFHLKQSLWLEDQYDMVQLTDDISCDLDAAMTVRRDGVPGKRTPDGILTKFAGLTIEKILRQIESCPEPATLGFAFTVLACDEETIQKLSTGIDKAAKMFDDDQKGHDITVSLRSVPVTGVIVHCNRDPVDIARHNLQRHCENRKYIHKAEGWFGICIEPHSKELRFGIELEFPWEEDTAMDRRTSAFFNQNLLKVGRNDPCPCGSGRKYKKCHLE